MKAVLHVEGNSHKVDLEAPLDISIVLQSGNQNPNAWYVNPPKIEAERNGNWVGSVAAGASVNFNHISFNPHAHGTHTECVGHITPQKISLQDCLKHFFFLAEVITITPQKVGDDFQITKLQIEAFKEKIQDKKALVIRTSPNKEYKKTKQYNHTNWAYFTKQAMEYVVLLGVEHLLIDLPSVDKEKDEGKLEAHKAFWCLGKELRLTATITEFIYVPNAVLDGSYLLNLQIASFVNDASPSKPVLYKLV